MKRIVLAIAALMVWGLGNTLAEDHHTNSVRTIKAPQFARPLVEKWIEEYAKTQPGVTFQIAKGQGESDLSVAIAGQQEDNPELFSHCIYIGETAVLPITARSSEAARLLEGKHLNVKKLKQLFFLGDEFEEDVKKEKAFQPIIIYSGSNATSAATSFARNFGEERANFRGKRIAGDDLFLNTAIGKDPLGVSFNTLPNIFDLQSRQLKRELTLIGLDLKKEAAHSFSGTLDDIISSLENGKPAEVAIEKVGFSFNSNDEAAGRFLQWVLENGTKYNHQYGLLNLSPKEEKAQIDQINNTLTAQK